MTALGPAARALQDKKIILGEMRKLEDRIKDLEGHAVNQITIIEHLMSPWWKRLLARLRAPR